MTFGERLRRWREPTGRTQETLGEAIGKSRTLVAGIEAGTVIPPDRPTCLAIGRALGLPDPEDVWRAAAPERVRKFDADAADFYEADGAVVALRHDLAAAHARITALEARIAAARSALGAT